MSVDATTVRRIAHLARIAVTDAEVPHLQGELNAMLAFVEQLSEVNVEGVEPMTSVTPMEMKKRADVVNDGGIADDIVQERAGDRGSLLPGAEGRRIGGARIRCACSATMKRPIRPTWTTSTPRSGRARWPIPTRRWTPCSMRSRQ